MKEKNMKCLKMLFGFVVYFFGIGMLSAAPLKVIATTPDLADVTRQVGGEFVSVESLAKGTEDIHAVPQRPSFVPKLNQADAVVVLGFDAEHAFLPALLDVAQNPKILRGQKGYIDCSERVQPLDVPVVISRAEGEQHPLGNPHYNIDPRNGSLIAESIAKGLERLDPAHAAVFEKNKQAFDQKLQAKIAEWKKSAASLRGIKAVSYHPSMPYFADFLGITMIGTVELKPGVAPTPKHLEELVEKMKDDKVTLILREVQYSDSTALWLASQTNAKIATVATIGGAFPDSQTYIGMVEHNIQSVLTTVAAR
jgi:ABC-type Zn uptake system ZnuABC Zn-binding protein ZnuA